VDAGAGTGLATRPAPRSGYSGGISAVAFVRLMPCLLRT
jgi:hypothetical protein